MLEVLPKPPKITATPANVNKSDVLIGSLVEVSCSYNGDFPGNVTWKMLNHITGSKLLNTYDMSMGSLHLFLCSYMYSLC